MDQQLLPPYAATTMDLKSAPGKLPLRFPPLAPRSTAPFYGGGKRDDRCSGGLLRTIVLCVLALAVCAGFVMLYLQMRDLERQVRVLREQTEALRYRSFDDGETELEGTSHSRKQDLGETRDRFPDGDDWDLDDDDVLNHHKGHMRERRSINSGLSSRRQIHHQVHQGEPSAHVVPLPTVNRQPSHNYYPASAWFEWTDQTSRISHASIPLHHSGRYLIAPHAGYFYIYSQVTLRSCNNATDSIGRGHSLYFKTMCGRGTEQKLTHTVTTPYNRNVGCTLDSGYIGGVYYLEKYDHVGVKPFLPSGILQSRIDLAPTNSYFGMILISRFNRGTQPTCYLS